MRVLRDNAKRAKDHLFAAQATYYDTPVTLTGGEGTHVRDDAGHTYLDAFAGIATNTVGYGDTEVAQAVGEQAKKLVHTSTLYLTDELLDLAEKIAAVSPEGMTKSFVSNSGSEANEMAALVARTATGSLDILALEQAYHGRTAYTVGLAGQGNWRNFAAPYPHVAFVPAPYCYRCPLGLSYPSCEIACARSAKRIIETQTSGAPAAMIAETIAGVGGIITPPPEYFNVLRETLAPFGTLLIADEVQTGWGRLGDGMFGMPSSYGVVPDIITSAKGLGSGIPIGITITRPELADTFKGPHINTFGGNPVSSRAALVTLEVIEKRDLIANAKRQGETLITALRELARRYPMMGEVRGRGLMIGVELVKDGKTKTYATAETARFLEEMRTRGVLVGKGGRFGNVIRIQPPLVLRDEDSSEFLRAFEGSIAAIA
ncbi:MAG TPA: aspartate aminotransferase family protein [Candidatus Baltobacteraceae bacterium]|jgi:4-aminobutyrate aminotransferase-like enzyme|nr:aspartate aminotransferase family protein [Candidatus Baltobacteraceae bacterium]